VEARIRRKRFTEEQIGSILKESAAGMKIEDVCRRHGICTNTVYRWKAKYLDMEISDVRKLKAIYSENARLKKIVAEQALDIQALKVVVSKKF
jgi:putative transposase